MRADPGVHGTESPRRTADTPEDHMACPRTTHDTAGTTTVTCQTSDLVISSTGQGSCVTWVNCTYVSKQSVLVTEPISSLHSQFGDRPIFKLSI